MAMCCPSEVPKAMYSKFSAANVVLKVVSNVGHIMPPQFFSEGLKVNFADYNDGLVLLSHEFIARNKRPYIFIQDCLQSHKAETTQE